MRDGRNLALEWDAAEYEVLSGPQTGWGANLLELFLERQPLRGDEAVVDAGCGTGRVTELLLRHIPDGRVLAVDGSKAMVEAAAGRFAGDPRVRVKRQDLIRLEVERPVDLIFSTATFHWIKDHELLFDRLARALKPKGRLVAQCGGAGNIARVQAAIGQVMDEASFRRFFVRWESPWNFADPGTTKTRLEAAGFEEVETWLHDGATEFGSVDELARFLKAAVLGQHLTFLPKVEHEPFATAVAERLAAGGPLVADYVRLNILATRSGVDAFGGGLGTTNTSPDTTGQRSEENALREEKA
jgi:trans-aconitate 2-methyltransferase